MNYPPLNLSDVNYTTYNPAVVNRTHQLVNVRAGASRRVKERGGVAHSSVLLVEQRRARAGVLREIEDAEDARPFWFKNALHIVFSRYRRRRFRTLVLARLEPPYREVPLQYANSSGPEGNWMPFEHAGRLFVSYSLCPHTVLEVNVETGVCSLAYQTQGDKCKQVEQRGRKVVGYCAQGQEALGDGCPIRRPRGSAAGAPLGDGTALGIGHYRTANLVYSHFFFLRSMQPPFDILRVSREFFLGATTPVENHLIRPSIHRQQQSTYAFAECVRSAKARRTSTGLCSAVPPLSLPYSDTRIQFATNLRRSHATKRAEGADSLYDATCAGGDELIIDFGASDILALTTRIHRSEFCTTVGYNFSHWCRCEPKQGPNTPSTAESAAASKEATRLARGAGPVLTSTRGTGPGGARFESAIVIKGPLLPFTKDVIAFYGRTLPPEVGVVFSHTDGPCFSQTRLSELRMLEAENANFAWTINAHPPMSGANYRNVQRESTYFGAKFAADALGAKFIFTQRADAIFQNASRLFPDLRRVRDAQPPPLVPMPGGRIGMCPTQLQLTDAYGRFHLDDHCMFGAVEAVLHFWDVANVYYRRGAVAWSNASTGNVRRGCSVPAVESDNGFIWVSDDLARRGVPLPSSTAELLRQRAFVINADAWGYVSRRKHAHAHLPTLPVIPAKSHTLPASLLKIAMPIGVYSLCEAREWTYDCSGVGADAKNRTDTPRWACGASNTRC